MIMLRYRLFKVSGVIWYSFRGNRRSGGDTKIADEKLRFEGI